MTTADEGAEHVQHLLGAYVLSALPADEDLAVSRHLAVCSSCAADAADLHDVRRVLDRLDEAHVARLLEAVGRAPTEPDASDVPDERDELAEPDASEVSETTDAPEPAPTGPASAHPGSSPTRPTRPAATRPGAPPTGPTGPAATRPAQPDRDRRRGTDRRWWRSYRTVLAALVVTLAFGVGLGGWLATRDPVDIRLAGNQTNSQTGVSVWVTVVGTTNGARVDALIEGLTVGHSYRLYAVGDRGESEVAVAWTARDQAQGVGGEVGIPIERLTTVTLTQADGSVLITVRLTAR